MASNSYVHIGIYATKLYLDSIIFLAESAYFSSCFLASPEYLGLMSLMGMSFMISRYMDCEISDVQTDGSIGSFPISTTFLSNNQRLNDSDGASIPVKRYITLNVLKFPGFSCRF